MHTIYLVSRNKELQRTIASALAGRFALSAYISIDEALPQLARAGTECKALLADLSNESSPGNLLTKLKQDGVILVAILDDPEKREAAFRAGADDYLLLPISQEEITAHLLRPIHNQEQSAAQRRIINDQEGGVTVGRLTSHICHEINNSMQATRGALALAMEKPNMPEELRPYFDLCDEETRRVVALVKKMRQIYHPVDAKPTCVYLTEILQESIQLAADEMSSRYINIIKDPDSDIPAIQGSCELIQIALLSLLLNLGEALGSLEGGNIRAGISCLEESALLHISVESSGQNLPNFTGISPADDIITGQGGKIEFNQQSDQISIRILFPIST